MEDVLGSYSHGDEIRVLCIIMGNAETKSNGHRRNVYHMDLVETMRRFHK
jgi:hypothetical protein